MTNTEKGSTSTEAKECAIDSENKRHHESHWKVTERRQNSGIVPTLAVFLWLGWYGTCLYVIIFVAGFSEALGRTIGLGLLVLSLALPCDFLPYRWGYRFGSWLMHQAEQYFGLKTVLENEEALKEHVDKPLIYAFEPHDILPYGVFCFNASLQRFPCPKNGENGISCLMTSAVFQTPFLRHVFTWVGGASIDKKVFKEKLENKEHLCFIPGGVQEVALLSESSKDDSIILYLNKRKGFIKLALQHNAPVVPAFGFNLDGSFGWWMPDPTTTSGSIFTKLGRAIGFLPVMFWGRFGIPIGIPKPRPLHIVVGKPIPIPSYSELNSEVINAYHDKFLRELEALYNRHKDSAGYGHRELKIV